MLELSMRYMENEVAKMDHKIVGGGINSILLRRFNLNQINGKEDNEVSKSYVKILDFNFDESGMLPGDVDVSSYTDFFIIGTGLKNNSTNDSALYCHFEDNESAALLETNKSTVDSSYDNQVQMIIAHYNGLFLEQRRSTKIKAPQYATNQYSQWSEKSVYMLNGNYGTLKFKYPNMTFSNSLMPIAGNITIYAK